MARRKTIRQTHARFLNRVLWKQSGPAQNRSEPGFFPDRSVAQDFGSLQGSFKAVFAPYRGSPSPIGDDILNASPVCKRIEQKEDGSNISVHLRLSQGDDGTAESYFSGKIYGPTVARETKLGEGCWKERGRDT